MKLSRIYALVKLEVKRFFTEPLSLVFTILLVPILILVFGFAMGNSYGWSDEYTIFEIMVPGLLAYGIILSIYDVAASVAGNKEMGLQRRINTTPVTTTELYLSQLIAYTIKPLIQFGLGYGIAYAIGYRPQVSALAYLVIIVFVILLAFCSVGFGLITANLVKGAGAAGGLAFAFIVPQQIFATFIPPAFMGADSFKWIFPSIYTTEGMGWIFAGTPLGSTFILMRLGILFAITVVVYAIGIFVYERNKNKL